MVQDFESQYIACKKALTALEMHADDTEKLNAEINALLVEVVSLQSELDAQKQENFVRYTETGWLSGNTN